MKKIVFLISVLVLMFLITGSYSGCATVTNIQQESIVPKYFTFESDPPGIKIESNGLLIGTTPFSYNFEKLCPGDENNFHYISFKIKAFPQKPGQYLQEKELWCYKIKEGGTIYFNMNIAPAPEEKKIDLNIKNK